MANLSNLNPELIRLISGYAGLRDSISLSNTSTAIHSVFTDKASETMRKMKDYKSQYNHAIDVLIRISFINQFVDGLRSMSRKRYILIGQNQHDFDPDTDPEAYSRKVYVDDLASVLVTIYMPFGLSFKKPFRIYESEMEKLIRDFFLKGRKFNEQDGSNLLKPIYRLFKSEKDPNRKIFINNFIITQEAMHSAFDESKPSKKGRVSYAVSRYIKEMFTEIRSLVTYHNIDINSFIRGYSNIGDRGMSSYNEVLSQYEQMVKNRVNTALVELQENLIISETTADSLGDVERFAMDNHLIIAANDDEKALAVMYDDIHAPGYFEVSHYIPFPYDNPSVMPMKRQYFSDYGLSVGHIPYPYETMTDFDMRRRPSKKSIKRTRRSSKKSVKRTRK